MKKTRLIFAGTPDFAKIALQALIDHQDRLNIDIVAVYTQPDRKAGRGQKLTQSPVKALALANGISVEQPASFSLNHQPADGKSGQVSRETLVSYRPDVMVVAAYGLILPQAVLNIPTHGCINIHASLLPRWRGAAPIQRAILAGDTQTGITIMQMDKGLDTGDMLYKVACPITDTDTAQTLHDALATLGAEAVVATLANLAALQKNATSQDDSLATYAQKITTKEGFIDFNQGATHIDRQIRALSAYAFLDNGQTTERVKILSAHLKPTQTTSEPAGSVVSVGKKAVLVACGADDGGKQRLINLTQMQWAGGKVMDSVQIANSGKINDGDRFGADQ